MHKTDKRGCVTVTFICNTMLLLSPHLSGSIYNMARFGARLLQLILQGSVIGVNIGDLGDIYGIYGIHQYIQQIEKKDNDAHLNGTG